MNEQLREQLAEAGKDVEELKANHAAAESARRTEASTHRDQTGWLRETIDSLTKTLEAAREELAARQRRDRSRERLLQGATAAF